MRRSRHGPADRANDQAEQLQREQRPRDRLQTGRVRGDERVARAAAACKPMMISRLPQGEGESLNARLIPCSFGVTSYY
jgi:hypothetical protein